MVVYIMLIVSIVTFTLIIDIFISNNDKEVIIKEKLTDDVSVIFEDKK